jgi:hypothetical protein
MCECAMQKSEFCGSGNIDITCYNNGSNESSIVEGT